MNYGVMYIDEFKRTTVALPNPVSAATFSANFIAWHAVYYPPIAEDKEQICSLSSAIGGLKMYG